MIRIAEAWTQIDPQNPKLRQLRTALAAPGTP
jgi:hypothetical protein